MPFLSYPKRSQTKVINLPPKIITFPQKVLTWCLDAGEQRNWRVATFSSLSPSLTCDHPLSNYLTLSQTVSHCLQCPPFNISLHSSMVWMCQNSNNLCLVWYPLRYPFSHYMHKNTFQKSYLLCEIEIELVGTYEWCH